VLINSARWQRCLSWVGRMGEMLGSGEGGCGIGRRL